ncbi:MAG TPA: AMP-binding protein [Solirubrobacteraceae bacterium]|nr:AMP-binding protein [Solirubrobacteraceae bacterium]
MNAATWLARAASERPDHPALVHGARTLSYAELADRVARLAACLAAAGLQPGDRVAAVQWNGPALLETLLACFHGGFCVVPVNARATPHEAAEVLGDAQVSGVVYDPEYGEHVDAIPCALRLALCTRDGADAPALDDALAGVDGPAPVAARRPDDVAWLFYTSGTTGHPKGAMLTHRNLLTMVMAYLADLRDPGPDAVVLHAAPLTHGGGLYALPPLARGATQLITASRSFDPNEVLDTVAARGVTDIAFLTPTMVKWLVQARSGFEGELGTLAHVTYGGAPMYVEELRAALDVFGPVFSQIYGQAEAPVTISRLSRADHVVGLEREPDLLASAGRAYTNVCAAVATDDGAIAAAGEGELVTRSDAVMRGYWNNPDATAESLRDGWLHTGDLGRITGDGLVFLLDRNKDVIISGGANIYPREVEEVILRHGGVDQVAVVGAPDETWGERVVAVVVPTSECDRASLQDDLDGLCREYLSGYKRPRAYDWRRALPVSPYGKILKREIRDEFWDRDGRQI